MYKSELLIKLKIIQVIFNNLIIYALYLKKIQLKNKIKTNV